MVKIEEYEAMFKKNGWDSYICNLYEFIANRRDVNVLINYLQEVSRKIGEIRSVDKMKLNKLENIFRENGWDNYTCNLYEWIAKGKDFNILIKFLEESVGKIEMNHNSEHKDSLTKNRAHSISCSKPEDF